MKNAELNRQAKHIEELLKRTSAAVGSDDELRAHWAKYLCVLCAGLLENAIQILYSEFISGASSVPVAKFATGHIGKLMNPKSSKFLEVAGSFKEVWRTDLESFLQIDGRSDAIDAVISTRHLIAHGKSSGISIARLREYFEKVVETIEFIEKQVTT